MNSVPFNPGRLASKVANTAVTATNQIFKHISPINPNFLFVMIGFSIFVLILSIVVVVASSNETARLNKIRDENKAKAKANNTVTSEEPEKGNKSIVGMQVMIIIFSILCMFATIGNVVVPSIITYFTKNPQMAISIGKLYAILAYIIYFGYYFIGFPILLKGNINRTVVENNKTK